MLEEAQVAFEVGVTAKGVRDLLQDDREADRGEHPFDHGRGYVFRYDAEPQRSERELNDPRDDDRGEERLVRAELFDGRENDQRQACRGPADADLRAGEDADDEAPDDPRNQATHQGRAGREGNAEAQREGH